jgi:hypothetical protein
MRTTVSIAILALALAGCVSQPHASPQAVAQLVSGPISTSAVRLYVYPGHIFWSDGNKNAYLNSIDVAVDDKKVGGANSGQVLILDIPPGPHTITKFTKTIWGDMHPISMNVSAAGGQSLYLAANVYATAPGGGLVAAGVLGGAVGGLLYGLANTETPSAKPPGDYLEESITGPQDIQGLTVVVPSNVP